ncbi:MAG TPA: lytic transglycosylase domain-containing protein [Salinivirgaceae bacterium]|nr:lytic transglycosylase domain-containing protein [Salinivirgaceae bacterium]
MQKIKIISATALLFLTATYTLKKITSPTETPAEIIDFVNDSAKVSLMANSVPIPIHLTFAGESVPLENFDVRERLERELLVNTYWHSNTMLLIKRANRFLPRISKILQQNGLPDDLKYIPLIESSLTNSISPANAAGFWQFLEETGKEYGLEINTNVDERFHVEKATQAACLYFKWLYGKFGSWTLAATAYNGGPKALIRFMDTQKNNNFYNLLLAEETERYIFRILSMKIIMNDPERYGFKLEENDLYPAIKTQPIEIKTSINDLAQWSLDRGFSYRELKFFNPWLRTNQLPVKNNQTYNIEIPDRSYRTQYQHLIY